MAGAPQGNQNAKKGRRWANAVERAVEAYPNKAVSLESNKGIDAAAYEFVHTMMVDKDIGFFKEFGDRLDGKPAQAIIGDPDNPLEMLTRIERVVRKPEGKK